MTTSSVTCQECRARLQDYLDGELDPVEARIIGMHLSSCIPCRQEWLHARAVVDGLRDLADHEEVPPPELRETVLAAIQGARERRPVRSLLGSTRLAWGVSGVVALISAVLLTLQVRTPTHTPQDPEVAVQPAVGTGQGVHLPSGVFIEPVSPEDNGAVLGNNVVVCAALMEAPSTGMIVRLEVDGRDLSGVADVTSDYVMYASEEPLHEGPHIVTVTVFDAQSGAMLSERSWVFFVLSPGTRGDTESTMVPRGSDSLVERC